MLKKIKKLFRKDCNDLIISEAPAIKVDFFYTTNACPYCGVIFDKLPARKKKCSSCKNTFYKRTLYPSTAIFLKEEELEYHKEYLKEYELKQNARKYLRYVINAFDNRCIENILLREEIKYLKEINKNNIGSLRNIYSYSVYYFLLKDEWEKSFFYLLKMLYFDCIDSISYKKVDCILEYWIEFVKFLYSKIELPIVRAEKFFVKANKDIYEKIKNIDDKVIDPPNAWLHIKKELYRS